MPTYQRLPRFIRDYRSLSAAERAAFKRAVGHFIEDLGAGRKPRPGLRVKGVQSAPGVFEMTWSSDGRATFSYGASVIEGEAHIVWRGLATS